MKRVLFLGEDSLFGAGRYLNAILRYSRLSYDYMPDQKPIPKAWLDRKYAAVILSDYRASSWTPAARRWLTEHVNAGMGLFMIGGWASFTGLVGKYKGSAIERLLPVTCKPGDDRVNASAVLLAGDNSPIVCGYQRVSLKTKSKMILQIQDLAFRGGRIKLGKKYPGLVIGNAGHGRTAAFLTDTSPHWAGGLVDWGTKRVTISLGKGQHVEVGHTYLNFFRKWLTWVARAAQ